MSTLDDDNSNEDNGAKAFEDLCNVLLANYGSYLRAWRELDESGDGELTFEEFFEAIGTIGWAKERSNDVGKAWTFLLERTRDAAGKRANAITLKEFSAVDAKLVDDFKDWARRRFGGTVEMFKAIDTEGKNAVSLEEFQKGCNSFETPMSRAKLYVEGIDIEKENHISLRQILWLEDDRLKRKAALDPQLVLFLEEGHRLNLVNKRRSRRARMLRLQGLKSFKKKLKEAAGGSFVRGWRTLLEIDSNLGICQSGLFKGCRKIAFDGDVNLLWNAMDTDKNGVATLEEVHPKDALILAGFKRWCCEKYDGCDLAIETLGALRKTQSPKWNFYEFYEALREAGFPAAQGPNGAKSIKLLHAALDVHAKNKITSQDADFLDRWAPSPWVVADVDYEGKDQFLSMLSHRYQSLIVAWRRVLDVKNTNCVGFKEFSNCCKKLKMAWRAPGLWRAFDQDMTGMISLNEVDPKSHAILMGFKRWAESNFGTICRMFSRLDSTRSTSLSLTDFKSLVKDFGYIGDLEMLCHCLKPEVGKHEARVERISYREDLKHLESWEDSSDNDPADDLDGSHHEEHSVSWERRRATCGRCNRHDGWVTVRELCENAKSDVCETQSSLKAICGLHLKVDKKTPTAAKASKRQLSKAELERLHYTVSNHEYDAFCRTSGKASSLETVSKSKETQYTKNHPQLPDLFSTQHSGWDSLPRIDDPMIFISPESVLADADRLIAAAESHRTLQVQKLLRPKKVTPHDQLASLRKKAEPFLSHSQQSRSLPALPSI